MFQHEESSSSATPDDMSEGVVMSTCNICFEEYPSDSGQMRKIEACEHSFCQECFSDSLTNFITQQNRLDIGCLQHGCDAKPTESEIKALVSEEVFIKYKLFRQNARVLKNRQEMFYCPTIGCGSVINDKRSTCSSLFGNQIIACTACNQDVCLGCREHAHDNLPCSNSFNEVNDWSWSLGWYETSNCPSCDTLIERHGGCPQFRCSACHTQFCWACLTENHSWLHLVCCSEGRPGLFCELVHEMLAHRKRNWCEQIHRFLFPFYGFIVYYLATCVERLFEWPLATTFYYLPFWPIEKILHIYQFIAWCLLGIAYIVMVVFQTYFYFFIARRTLLILCKRKGRRSKKND